MQISLHFSQFIEIRKTWHLQQYAPATSRCLSKLAAFVLSIVIHLSIGYLFFLSSSPSFSATLSQTFVFSLNTPRVLEVCVLIFS